MTYIRTDVNLMPTFMVGEAIPFAERKDSTSPLGNIEIFTNRLYIVEQYLKSTFGGKIDITHRTQRSIQFDVLAVKGSDLYSIHSKLASLNPIDIFGEEYRGLRMEDLAPRTKYEKKAHQEARVETRRISWLCQDTNYAQPDKVAEPYLLFFDDAVFTTKIRHPMSW